MPTPLMLLVVAAAEGNALALGAAIGLSAALVAGRIKGSEAVIRG